MLVLNVYIWILSTSSESEVPVEAPLPPGDMVSVVIVPFMFNSSSAWTWLEPSSELWTQYNIMSSPIIAVAVEDQVVGAAGFSPIDILTISDQDDLPCWFTALTLK